MAKRPQDRVSINLGMMAMEALVVGTPSRPSMAIRARKE
jgi:hypothetical protein